MFWFGLFFLVWFVNCKLVCSLACCGIHGQQRGRSQLEKVREKSGFLSRKDQGFPPPLPSWLQILEQSLHCWVSIFLHIPIFPPQIKYLRRNLRSHPLWPLTSGKWLQYGSSLVQQVIEGLTLKLDFSSFQNSYHLPPTTYHWTYLQWHEHFSLLCCIRLFFLCSTICVVISSPDLKMASSIAKNNI